ncbi:ethanolamine ammonia-lyase reactivating factor EutA [Anaerovorax sp. IOR16]|uniref:ethanolamine ammonia-lyase reactivating factor EutA n=1 Tax=Anaerovorax sp. IOR16 TaxID=2773458 RepID=UPI002ED03FF6
MISVGIDIGTSTTQLIFSRLTIENRASAYAVPRVEIVNKEVIYSSEIYFTPLQSSTEIDAEAVSQIIRNEYQKAGMTPDQVTTGAVIITGETARKQNANLVLNRLSDLAGDFVVATAGPDLESVLSGRGAGADRLSEENRNIVANLDIGGGTTNISVFRKGSLYAVTCLDVGGRLVKVENGKITYIYTKLKELAERNGILIQVGESAEEAKLRKICKLMANQIKEALQLSKNVEKNFILYTNDGKGLPEDLKISAVTFSGGVAGYVYEPEEKDLFRYGDVGVLLGQEINRCGILDQVLCYKSDETIRATVVGAGTHTTEVSGSTIFYKKEKLPMKNVPILRLADADEETPDLVSQAILRQMPIYQSEDKLDPIAISLTGSRYSSFTSIQKLADAIINATVSIQKKGIPLIVMLESDVGKALGNAINIKLRGKTDVVCIDGIKAQGGDYVDLGEPVGGGHVLPVVVKTLIFNS